MEPSQPEPSADKTDITASSSDPPSQAEPSSDRTEITAPSGEDPGIMDVDIPTWLEAMVARVRTCSDDARWRALINSFILFEMSGPPVGVSFIFLFSYVTGR